MGRLLPAALAVGLVLLAGCSGDDDPEPKISPTDSSSVASTPTPSPTPSGPVEPTMPAEAEGEDAAAAEAFVRFYWEMVGYAQATGDVAKLRSLGSRYCAACSAGLESIVRTYEAGGSITGGGLDIREVSGRRVTSHVGRAFAVTVSGVTESQTVREPGKEDREYAGGSVRFKFVVQIDNRTWTVARWDVA